MRIQLPWVSRALADEKERQIVYRDEVIARLQRERDAAVEEAARARDELIMYLGARPVSAPVRADIRANQAKAEEEARAVAEAFAGVDAETQLIIENLAEPTN